MAINLHEHCYIVCLKFKGGRHFLLWQDGGDKPDTFVLQPGSSHFLQAKAKDALWAKAKKLGLRIAEQEPVVSDMDSVFSALAALRPGRASSSQACKVLLEGWNTLEDLARPLEIPLERRDANVEAVLHSAYDKLFYGNNLPAVTPPGREFNPLFSAEERKEMRKYLRYLWQQISERGGFEEKR